MTITVSLDSVLSNLLNSNVSFITILAKRISEKRAVAINLADA